MKDKEAYIPYKRFLCEELPPEQLPARAGGQILEWIGLVCREICFLVLLWLAYFVARYPETLEQVKKEKREAKVKI